MTTFTIICIRNHMLACKGPHIWFGGPHWWYPNGRFQKYRKNIRFFDRREIITRKKKWRKININPSLSTNIPAKVISHALTPFKVKFIAWLALFDPLPISEILTQHNITVSFHCPLCRFVQENLLPPFFFIMSVYISNLTALPLHIRPVIPLPSHR